MDHLQFTLTWYKICRAGARGIIRYDLCDRNLLIIHFLDNLTNISYYNTPTRKPVHALQPDLTLSLGLLADC